MLSGSRASDTPGQAPLCPQRRPPRPRHPIVGVCYRGGLRLGRHAAPRRDLTDSKRGNCTIRGTTRRRHAEGRLLMLQNPHHYPWRHAPARVERTRSGGILPMGRIPSEALRREHASTMTDDASARHRQPPSAARSRQRHRYLPRRCWDRASSNTLRGDFSG